MALMVKTTRAFLFATTLVAFVPSFAKLTKLTKSPVEKKCSRRALQLKNCYLDLDHYSIRIWNQKVSVSNKVSRSLVDLPLSGEKVEWVSGQIEKLGGAYFIQWVAWEAPAEKSDIQTKIWYVYRLKDEKADLILTRPMVKRIKSENSKPKADDEIKYGLRLEKKDPAWFFGKEKGLLK